MPTPSDAGAKCCIAALEQEIEVMWQERGSKQRKTSYYVAQGRAIHHLVILYNSLEDLIAENDHRQDHLQHRYIELAHVLLWLHGKLGDLDYEDLEDMLKKA
ncbi:hypothetical protein BDR07DRAFT_1382355 [Suillus spraguei]|nr:hypothetical protein BDR07DRAFT_1382355 [Suillus spraguei]